MKKILQITNYLYPHIGGIEQVTRDILNTVKNDYEQRIICFNHDKGTIVDEVDGVEVTRVRSQIKIASQQIALSFGKNLKKIMNEFQPDIVIFHYPNPFEAAFLSRYLKKKKFKFVLYWHLDITKQKLLGKLFSGQNKKLLRYADKIVTTSPNYIAGSPWLSQYKEKCVAIPCCVNEERLSYNDYHIELADNIRKKYTNKKICFAFGRHVPYKGIEYLVKAASYLDDSFQILIGGKGPLTEELIKMAKKNPNIIFLGRITDDELKANLLACDIFCFPSITKNEAFGIGLVEAMYYSKPVITFNIPGSGVNFVAINNETCYEVENCDSRAYAEAIVKLSSDKEIMNKFAINGKNRVSELFLQSHFENAIKNMLEFNN